MSHYLLRPVSKFQCRNGLTHTASNERRRGNDLEGGTGCCYDWKISGPESESHLSVVYLEGDIVAMRKVQASPPKAPCSKRVSLESL